VGKRFSGVTESIQVSRPSGGSRWLADAAEGRGEGNEGSSAFHFPTSSCGSAARALPFPSWDSQTGKTVGGERREAIYPSSAAFCPSSENGEKRGLFGSAAKCFSLRCRHGQTAVQLAGRRDRAFDPSKTLELPSSLAKQTMRQVEKQGRQGVNRSVR
jgi:hypothetical protein